jgi:hypothetical protein
MSNPKKAGTTPPELSAGLSRGVLLAAIRSGSAAAAIPGLSLSFVVEEPGTEILTP